MSWKWNEIKEILLFLIEVLLVREIENISENLKSEFKNINCFTEFPAADAIDLAPDSQKSRTKWETSEQVQK